LPAGTKLTTRTFLDGQALGSAKTFALSQEAIETRTSQQMGTCDNKLVLNLEDDGPSGGDRAVILTDILHPCWLWRGADTARGLAITAEVGSMPFNFQLGNHANPPKSDTPVSEAGELNVHLGTCEGPVVTSLPLGNAGKNTGISVLKGTLPATAGTNDLCFSFGQKAPPPQWVLKSVRLTVQGK
jgi:hexosaminidase